MAGPLFFGTSWENAQTACTPPVRQTIYPQRSGYLTSVQHPAGGPGFSGAVSTSSLSGKSGLAPPGAPSLPSGFSPTGPETGSGDTLDSFDSLDFSCDPSAASAGSVPFNSGVAVSGLPTREDRTVIPAQARTRIPAFAGMTVRGHTASAYKCGSYLSAVPYRRAWRIPDVDSLKRKRLPPV